MLPRYRCYRGASWESGRLEHQPSLTVSEPQDVVLRREAAERFVPEPIEDRNELLSDGALRTPGSQAGVAQMPRPDPTNKGDRSGGRNMSDLFPKTGLLGS